MDKQTMKIIGVAALILVAAFMFAGKKEFEYLYAPATSLADCESRRSTQIGVMPCVTECTEVTQTIADCVAQCGCADPDLCDWTIGRWAFGYSDLTCQSAYDTYPEFKCKMDCTYGGLPSGTCNTAADANCDGLVSNSELLNYMNFWLSNQITNQELMSSITAWITN